MTAGAGDGPRRDASGRVRYPSATQTLHGADSLHAEVLREAVADGTARTSGLAGLTMTRAEAELALRALWRAGYDVCPRVKG